MPAAWQASRATAVTAGLCSLSGGDDWSLKLQSTVVEVRKSHWVKDDAESGEWLVGLVMTMRRCLGCL